MITYLSVHDLIDASNHINACCQPPPPPPSTPPSPTLLGLYWTPLSNEHLLSDRRYLMKITPEYTRQSDIEKKSPIIWYSVSCSINKGEGMTRSISLVVTQSPININERSAGGRTWGDGTQSLPFVFLLPINPRSPYSHV